LKAPRGVPIQVLVVPHSCHRGAYSPQNVLDFSYGGTLERSGSPPEVQQLPEVMGESRELGARL
jgi:hypothetical protein